ncbi:MAG TPA: class I SAM-dependent methyltransferase [Myxococcales bacterium]|nr:class I SAM-dependent methyltransferase [Myxococcales bacterium]
MRGVEQIPLVYDAMAAVTDRIGLWKLRSWLVRGASGLTLELGCGTGRNLPRYPPTARLVGIDPSLDSLHRARRRAPAVPLVCASAEALPFRDGIFDTVAISLVLCSVPEPAAALREVRRVLRDPGAVRLLEHVRSERRWMARWQDFIQPAWTRITGGCHPNRDTESAVRRAGFRIDERKANRNLRRLVARKAD